MNEKESGFNPLESKLNEFGENVYQFAKQLGGKHKDADFERLFELLERNINESSVELSEDQRDELRTTLLDHESELGWA